MQQSRRVIGGVLILALFLSPAGFAYAGVPDGDEFDLEYGESASPESKASSELEKLTLPAVTAELLETATAIEEEFSADPRYNTVEITEDRSGVVVWWHGDKDAKLSKLIASAAVDVTIAASEYLPSELRAAARKALESDLGITAAWVPKEGNGIEVAADPGSEQSRVSPEALEESLRNVVGVPVSVSPESGPTTTARQNDIYVMGGARVYAFGGGSILGGCSTGFPVQNTSGGKGMMFAAHCGAVGSQWVRWPNSTGPTVYAYGNNGVVSARTTSYDGAIIATTFNNPGFYTSAWNSSTYTALNGATFAPVGSEVCYTGSYSGLVCGNIVQEHGVVYNLGGDLTSVIGMRTLQTGGIPSVGNGDSGGPGYALVNVSGTLKRYAVSIISAIPTGSPATCTGVPGDPAAGGRKCSTTVYATSVPQIASALGWTLTTTP